MTKVENDCPECRRREAIAIEEQEIADAALRARAERRDELCEKLTPAIIDALAPLAAKMPRGEPISISVGWKINLTLGSNGVLREEDNEDLPF
jgi:hypothetical protein